MGQAVKITCAWHCTLVFVSLLSAICGFYTGLYAGSVDGKGRPVGVNLFPSRKTFGLQEDTARFQLWRNKNATDHREADKARRNATTEGNDEMPHVDDCGLCFSCYKEKQPFSENPNISVNMSEISLRLQKPSKWKMNPVDEAFFKVGPIDTRSHKKKPNCTECYGCDHVLRASSESTTMMMNKSYILESGASSIWVLISKQTGAAESKSDVVKVWCVPVLKDNQRGFSPCSANVMETIRNIASIQKIVEDCGFEDIVVKSWKARVNGVIENIGYHINWDGMWFEHAKGVSVELFLRKNTPKAGIELLRRANSTQVIHAALFDLLTSQCDRHSQNIFIDENGQLSLIDNDQSLAVKSHPCGVDSMILPTTEEYAIHQVGFGYVMKHTNSTRKNPALQTMLDYRCHAPGGKIGKKYPPKLKQCMENISSMTVQEVVETYGFQDAEQAEALRSRSAAMLGRGFEWALEFSPPHKPSKRAFQWYTPCCDFDEHQQCLDDAWHTDARLPPF